MLTIRSHALLIAVAVSAAIVVSACAGGTATPSPTGTRGGIADPTPVPGARTPGASIPVALPPLGDVNLVEPVAGLLDVREHGATRIEAAVEGRRVLVRLTWVSGVEPCTVLDSVRIDRQETTIAMSIREGSAARDVACIDLATTKATIVDLGELEPGSYTLVAGPDAPALTVQVD